MRNIFLTDNGSLRPASTMNLRRVAKQLSEKTGYRVEPVSLLHSSKVSASELEGIPARTVGPTIREAVEEGVKDFLILPFFFGPSRAITEYLPRRIAEMQKQIPDLDVRVAKPLVDLESPTNLRIAKILKEHVLQSSSGDGPKSVILVDHGSPEPAVTAIRNVLAGQLAVLLERERTDDVDFRVVPASMERREGSEYDFAGPLLETVLDRANSWPMPVILSMLFLSPGRHAGPDGDVVRICREAEERNPGLSTVMSGLVGEHDGIVDVLADRLTEALAEEQGL
ncbi:MAG: CbiX/SirB N-terminal domain-containing protein [Balneolaceae bacterium]